MTTQTPTTAKQQFLDTYEREHATTVKVLRAYPADRLDLRPHEKCKTARELAWVFFIERGLGKAVFNDPLEELMAGGAPPEPPATMDEIIAALESAHREFAELVRSTSDADMAGKVRFFTGPGTISEISRMQWCWFLLHDEIHHRGQFSIYLRMADGKVPSIYGPTADEPWA